MKAGLRFGGLVLVCGFFMLSIAAEAEEAEEKIRVTAFPNLIFSSENIVILPPGEIIGTALRSDQRTPHSDMEVALVDPETGEGFASKVTGEDGGFVFEDVPEGRYLVRVGNPGTAAMLGIEWGAEPGTFDIVVPGPMSLPVPGWAPGWIRDYPVLGYAAVGGAVIVGLSYWRYRKRRDRELSPIGP